MLRKAHTQILVSVLISSTTWVGTAAAFGAARCSRSLRLHAQVDVCDPMMQPGRTDAQGRLSSGSTGEAERVLLLPGLLLGNLGQVAAASGHLLRCRGRVPAPARSMKSTSATHACMHDTFQG
jgi:hypothetical protein